MAHKLTLVTGGFGFIGSTLTEELLKQPDVHVHVVDNLSTSPLELTELLEAMGRPKNLSYDVCSLEEYCERPASDTPRFDRIYHLASVVGPVGVLAHAGQITQMIVSDTYRIIELALRDGAKVLDVSTSEVYGGGREGYCSEEFSRIIPAKTTVRLEYAVAKLASEIALINTSRVKPLDVRIVRPFNVAGPRQSPKGGFVLPRFVGQALRGEPLTVYNDGSMIRAFTHVSDIARGLILAMELGATGEAYNLGNPNNKTSILDLAKRVIALTGSSSPISFVDPKTLFGSLFEEANDKYPNAQRATEELDWQPRYGTDTVITDTVAYMRDRKTDDALPAARSNTASEIPVATSTV